MTISKQGRVAGGNYGNTIYATPGQTVTWRIRVENRPSDQSYLAQNVVLSDTWPPIFDFITATVDPAFTTTVTAAQNTVIWDIGDIPTGDQLDFFITGTVAISADVCSAVATNTTRLTFGCDDGCTDGIVPQDTARLDAAPNIAVALSPDSLNTCAGNIPIIITNRGAAAYSTTLTLTLPSGYVYDHVVSAGLTPTEIISTPTSAPRFKWDTIPGHTGSSYAFTLVLGVKNSAGSGLCPSG